MNIIETSLYELVRLFSEKLCYHLLFLYLVPFRIFRHRSKKKRVSMRETNWLSRAQLFAADNPPRAIWFGLQDPDSIRSARSHVANSILSFMPNGNVHACTHARRGVARGSVCVNYLSIIERSFLQPRPKYLCCCGLVCRFNCYEIYISRSS